MTVRYPLVSISGQLQELPIGDAVTASSTVILHALNQTGATIAKGAVVYVSGASVDNPTLTLASASTEIGSSSTIGFVTATTTTGNICTVLTNGLFDGVDTSSTTAGASVWLSTVAGQVTFGNPPTQPTHSVFLGKVIRVQSINGSIFVAIQNGYEITELHDVLITSATNNNLLAYESSSALWKNVSAINGVSIGATTPSTGVFSSITKSGGTSSQFLKADGTTDSTSYLPSSEPTRASIRPSLLLDFANSKTLDPRITFSRASIATYFGKDGLLKTAASGSPRFDYDPITGESLGLLIEEQRTNLLTYSEQFDNAVWTKSAVTISANTTTAPDGTMTADKLIENTLTTSHYLAGSNYTATNTTITFSVFVKAAERSNCALAVSNFTNHMAYVIFNLVTLTANNMTDGSVDYTNVSATIIDVGNGWRKCVMTTTKSAVNSTNIANVKIMDGSSGTYTGDGTSGIYIWGAQLEVGSFPTSYIPTTTAQATRSADNAVMTGTNFSSWYRQDEGTVYVASNILSGKVPVSVIYSINDGTHSNAIGLYKQSSSNTDFIADVLNAGTQTGHMLTTISGLNISSGFGYKLNDCRYTTNGVTPLSDTSTNIPTVSTLSIGSRANAFYTSGHIAKLAYYPKQLTNSELIALSTV